MNFWIREFVGEIKYYLKRHTLIIVIIALIVNFLIAFWIGRAYGL